MENAGGEKSSGTRVGAAALLLAASVLLSRVLGYGREVLLAYRAGAGASTDAYYAAFQIPDLLNYLLAGGALSIAFLPLYTGHLARNDDAGAERLFSTVLGTLTAVTALATAILWWAAEPLVALQFPRFDPATQALTAHLTRITLPAQICFVAGGIVNATLLARERFWASAAAPLLYNLGIIAGGALLAPCFDTPVEGFAWGALAGSVAGPLLAPIFDARGRVAIRARFAPRDRAFFGYLLVAAPLMLGQSLLTVDEWYERWFGALLGPGAVAHLAYARKLMLVPVAVVGQALAAAALPRLSRLWAEKRRDELDALLLRTLQATLALGLIGAAAFSVFAAPLVQVIYQRGAFTAADTSAVASILTLLALAVPAWVTQQVATRAFYARGDTWRPMVLGTVIAAGVIPLYLALGRSAGVTGIATAGVIGMSLNAVATVLLARGLHGAPDLGALAATGGRAVAIGALAALVAGSFTGSEPVASSALALRDLVAGGIAFAIVTGLGAWFAGDEAIRGSLRRMVQRFR